MCTEGVTRASGVDEITQGERLLRDRRAWESRAVNGCRKEAESGKTTETKKKNTTVLSHRSQEKTVFRGEGAISRESQRLNSVC